MKYTSIIVAAGFALVALLPSLPATARSFVSPTGNDSNDCSLAAPCRNLQAAVYKTAPGGEIAVLGTAGYSGGATLVIDRAISIVNPGAFEAALSPPSGGIGIVINVGPNDAVSLRGLTIDGQGIGQTGVQLNTGGSLTIENCVIRDLTQDGIDFFPPAASNLTISNSLMADNGGSGITVSPSGTATITAVFNRVEANHNGFAGIYVVGASSTGTVSATVSDSVAAHNTFAGFYAYTEAGHAPTTFTVFHSVSAYNGTGLLTQHTGATLRLGQSVVTGNGAGWNIGGVLASYGDNYIDGNGANTGSLTPIGRQ